MRRLWLGILILVPLAAAPAAWSQQRPNSMAMDTAMRQRIERRFAERVREELRLTDDQAKRLATTTEQYAKRRQDLRLRERSFRKALADQLRPGVAADNDSIAKLTDNLVGLRLNYAESFRDELKDLSAFLNPVQRARLFTMRERLFRAAYGARGRRMGRGMDRDMDWRREDRHR